MGASVEGQYAAWNYFESVDTPANKKFIADWKKFPHSSGVTSDPMEAAYDSLYLYKAMVEKAKSFDVDKVVAASPGIELKIAPEGYVKLDENHHLWSKSRIAMGMPDATFKVVSESPELIKPDPFPKGYQ